MKNPDSLSLLDLAQQNFRAADGKSIVEQNAIWSAASTQALIAIGLELVAIRMALEAKS